MNDQNEIKLFNIGIKAIIISNNKVLTLLTYDENQNEYIDLPGGRINGEELITETLKRELHEELRGIKDIQIGGLTHAGRRVKNLKNNIGLMFLYYTVTADCSHITISNEHHAMQWKSIAELTRENKNIILQPDHEIAIHKALNKNSKTHS